MTDAFLGCVHAVAFKRTVGRTVEYVGHEEMKAILRVVDRRSVDGRRDYALLRCVSPTWLDTPASVHLGKGRTACAQVSVCAVRSRCGTSSSATSTRRTRTHRKGRWPWLPHGKTGADTTEDAGTEAGASPSLR